MSKFRKVSASDSHEAIELLVGGSTDSEGVVSIIVDDATTWPEECDFITFARETSGAINEDTRVVWQGTKVNSSLITATRVGGSAAHMPAGGEFATIVPTHKWFNDIAGTLSSVVSDDGCIVGLEDQEIVFSTAATEPAPIAGKTIIWFQPSA